MEQPRRKSGTESSIESSSSASDDVDDQRRKSSTRLIKRKKFDDEIVEHSLGNVSTRIASKTHAAIAESARAALERQKVPDNSSLPLKPANEAPGETAKDPLPSASSVLSQPVPTITTTSIATLPPPIESNTTTAVETPSSIATPTTSIDTANEITINTENTTSNNAKHGSPDKNNSNTNVNSNQSENEDSSSTNKNSNSNINNNNDTMSSGNNNNDTNTAENRENTNQQENINNANNNNMVNDNDVNYNNENNNDINNNSNNDNDDEIADTGNNRNRENTRNTVNVSNNGHNGVNAEDVGSVGRNRDGNVISDNSDNENNNSENDIENEINKHVITANNNDVAADKSTNAEANVDNNSINNNSDNSGNNVNNTSVSLDKKRSIKSTVSANKKSKKNRLVQQLTTKDLGRWKPIDDLSLIIGIQQTNDLRVVHRGVKFSCKFTIQELQNRWYSLLYDEPISRIAVAAMRNLHPELVAGVHSRALFTAQEEEILSTLKSTDNPSLETFQLLLNRNALNFYHTRTAKALMNHWNSMKQYMLLPDQIINNAKNGKSFSSLPDGDPNINFSDQEDRIIDADLAEPRDEALELELALADRKRKKEMRYLENELPRWTVLVDSITGIGIHPEFDNQTLAVLRGRLVRYLMRSREITLGRKSKHEVVDVDLNLEGPAYKVSRRQGTIKLRSNGDFFIVNEGKRPMFIDGMPLLQRNKTKLNNNCTIEVSGLRLVFLVNIELVNAIRQESAKMNGPLN